MPTPSVFDDLQPTAQTAGGSVFDELQPTPKSPEGYWSQLLHNIPSDFVNTVSKQIKSVGPQGPNWSPEQLEQFKTDTGGSIGGPDVGSFLHNVSKGIIDPIQNVWDTVTNLPEKLKQSPVGLPSTVAGLVGGAIKGKGELLPDEPPTTLGGEEVHPSVKKLTETLPVPRQQVPRFQEAAQTALPALREFAPSEGINLSNWHNAQDLAEAKREQAASSFIEPARDEGKMVDGNTIANAKIDAIPDAWRTNPKYRSQYEAAVTDAQNYRRPMSIDEVMGEINHNNQRLIPFYRASSDQQYAMQAAGFPLGDLEAESQGLRRGLAKTVDPSNDGAQFSQIQSERAKLITFRQQAEQLENQIQKQYTPTTVQKLGQKVSDLGSIWHGEYRQTIASKMKSAPELDQMFQDAFKNYNGPGLPPTPQGPTPKVSLPTSPDMVRHDPLGLSGGRSGPTEFDRPFGSQDPLGMNAPRSTSQNPGDLSHNPISTVHQPPTPNPQQFGGQSPTYAPVDLTHPTGSPQFIRQREWNEILTDPKVMAGEDPLRTSLEVGKHKPLQLQSPGNYPTRQGELFDQTPQFPARKDLSDRLRSAYDIITGRE